MVIGKIGELEQQCLEGMAGGMAVFLTMFLYVAWFVTWGGTFMTTCTMGDAKSLGGAMIYSILIYLAPIITLPKHGLSTLGLVLTTPLVLLLSHQAIWAVELFVVVSVDGRSACNLMMGDDYGVARGGWVEQSYAFYYFAVSVASLWAIASSHRRFRQNKSPGLGDT